LPGIGVFTLDEGTLIPEENEKQRTPVTGISYKKKQVNVIDEKLIDFVRTHTGKIKPLAHSDIESYLSLCTQLLNIGNPLFIDGIGTLIKNKEGDYIFTPGAYMVQKLEDITIIKENTEQTSRSAFDESYNRYEPATNNLRKLLLIAGIVLTIGLVAWGAYYLFKHNKGTTETQLPLQNDSTAIPTSNDTINNISVKPDASQILDSLKPVVALTGRYKFIIETDNSKERALRHYNQYISYKMNVELQTTDSITFKILYNLAATPADTTRIKDSLMRNLGRKVTVEQ
jgi:hypothetical protein